MVWRGKRECRKLISRAEMKLWKSKKSATTSCVTAVKNLSGGNKNYKNDDQSEISISAASTATPTNQIQMVNGLHQGTLVNG